MEPQASRAAPRIHRLRDDLDNWHRTSGREGTSRPRGTFAALVADHVGPGELGCQLGVGRWIRLRVEGRETSFERIGGRVPATGLRFDPSDQRRYLQRSASVPDALARRASMLRGGRGLVEMRSRLRP